MHPEKCVGCDDCCWKGPSDGYEGPGLPSLDAPGVLEKHLEVCALAQHPSVSGEHEIRFNHLENATPYLQPKEMPLLIHHNAKLVLTILAVQMKRLFVCFAKKRIKPFYLLLSPRAREQEDNTMPFLSRPDLEYSVELGYAMRSPLQDELG